MTALRIMLLLFLLLLVIGCCCCHSKIKRIGGIKVSERGKSLPGKGIQISVNVESLRCRLQTNTTDLVGDVVSQTVRKASFVQKLQLGRLCLRFRVVQQGEKDLR